MIGQHSFSDVFYAFEQASSEFIESYVKRDDNSVLFLRENDDNSYLIWHEDGWYYLCVTGKEGVDFEDGYKTLDDLMIFLRQHYA